MVGALAGLVIPATVRKSRVDSNNTVRRRHFYGARSQTRHSVPAIKIGQDLRNRSTGAALHWAARSPRFQAATAR